VLRVTNRVTFCGGLLPSLVLVLACMSGCNTSHLTNVTASPSPTSVIPAPTATLKAPTNSIITGFIVYSEQGVDKPIWILKGKDTPRIFSYGDWFQVSPSGHYIILVRGFPQELWLASSDGAIQRLLYTTPIGTPVISRMFWSPDETIILFGLTSPGAPASQDPGALWRLDITTGDAIELVGRGAHWPLFSPDSRWISIASPFATLASIGSIGIIDKNGHGLPRLFDFVNVQDRTWAEDSTGIMAAISFYTQTPATTELWWIPVQGQAVKLGELPYTAVLTWQPGGDRLVYRKTDDDEALLYLLESNDMSEVAIPDTQGLKPINNNYQAWSPDGLWLLVVNNDAMYSIINTVTRTVQPIPAQLVYGWVQPESYLTGMVSPQLEEQYHKGVNIPIDINLCTPDKSCIKLGVIPRMAFWAYAPR
jgi:hypothetical protein